MRLMLVIVLLAGCERTAPPLAERDEGPGSGSGSGSARDCADPLDRDRDQDGHPVQECGGDDCDDQDAFRFPGAGRELCAGKLPSGVMAAVHDEDCNPCTIAGTSDGDADHDGYPSASCSNDWLGSASRIPQGCDLNQIAVNDKAHGKTTRGLDCDDASYAVQPGRQICADSSHVSLCAPELGFDVLPTSTGKPTGKKDVLPTIDPATGIATVACPTGTTCQSQPDGSGICR